MRRVLVVGMLDSVHLARWLIQFKEQPVEIMIFPSRRYRKLHPELHALIKGSGVRYNQIIPTKFSAVSGYIDYFRHEIISRIFPFFSRSATLRRFLRKTRLDLLHLIELQHAGYLFLETEVTQEQCFKVITTNYGSDLVFYISDPTHTHKLQKLMSLSDYYSAECRRDYQIARTLGFKGVELPLMPNAGGFTEEQLNHSCLPLSERKIIYIKGYGGQFGLGEISLKVADKLLEIYPGINVVVTSLTDDLVGLATEIQNRYDKRFFSHTIRDPLSREQILSTLRQSIICIGASRSDGISTTFLEALVCGVVPIQTDTSCANEWTQKGFRAYVVPPKEDDVLNAAREVLDNIGNYEAAITTNLDLAKKHLASKTISSLAHSFYMNPTGDV